MTMKAFMELSRWLVSWKQTYDTFPMCKQANHDASNKIHIISCANRKFKILCSPSVIDELRTSASPLTAWPSTVFL